MSGVGRLKLAPPPLVFCFVFLGYNERSGRLKLAPTPVFCFRLLWNVQLIKKCTPSCLHFFLLILEILDTTRAFQYISIEFHLSGFAYSAILACHMKILENFHYLCQDILGIPEKKPSQSVKFFKLF